MCKCDYGHINGEGAQFSTRAPHGSCRQHWQSAEMEDRDSTSCPSAREPHAVLRQEEVEGGTEQKPIHPSYLCFLWQARIVSVPSNSWQMNFPEEAIFKEGATFAMDGNNKTGVFIIPGHREIISETHWDGGSKNNSRMRSIRNR